MGGGGGGGGGRAPPPGALGGPPTGTLGGPPFGTLGGIGTPTGAPRGISIGTLGGPPAGICGTLRLGLSDGSSHVFSGLGGGPPFIVGWLGTGASFSGNGGGARFCLEACGGRGGVAESSSEGDTFGGRAGGPPFLPGSAFSSLAGRGLLVWLTVGIPLCSGGALCWVWEADGCVWWPRWGSGGGELLLIASGIFGKGRFLMVDVGRSVDGTLISRGLVTVGFSGSPGRAGRGRIFLVRGTGESHCVTLVAVLW